MIQMGNIGDLARTLAAHWLDEAKKMAPGDTKQTLLIKATGIYHIELRRANPQHPLLEQVRIEQDPNTGKLIEFAITPQGSYMPDGGMNALDFLEKYAYDLQNAVTENDLL